MLRAALGFFVLALFAVLFGASGIAGISLEVGYDLLVLFLALALMSVVANFFTGRHSKNLH